MKRFELIRQDSSKEVIRLPRSGCLIIGRQHPSDVVFKSASNMSRKHAALRIEAGVVWIEDLSSRNGSWVNGVKTTRAQLNTGDRIQIGSIEFEFVEHDDTSRSESINETHIFMPSELFSLDPCTTQESRRGDRAFKSIVRLSREMIRVRPVSELLAAGLDLIHDLICADTCELYLFSATGELDPSPCRRSTIASLSPDAQPTIISRTLLNRVVSDHIAILAEDVGQNTTFQVAESIIAKGIRSLMAAPMLVDDRLLGVISAETRDLQRMFSPSTLEVLTAFANLLAVGLEQSRLYEEIEQINRVRQRLAQFHSPAVVEEILRRGGSILPEQRIATVWFCDIHGFTPYAEKHTPKEVESRIDAFFEMAVTTVFDFGGTLDKYLGDGFMAVFGAPIARDDDTIQAVRAAVALHARLATWNAGVDSTERICVRSGINTGRVIAGDIGASIRRDYTVIGDAVNIAQRLQQEIAGPDQIALGGVTAESARSEFRLHAVGPVFVKGRDTPIDAFLICAPWT